jgi:hypothetical protein
MDVDKISEQILRMLSGGDPAIESKIELAEIKLLVIQAGNDVAFDEYINNKKLDGQENPSSDWLMDFDITLTANSLTNEKTASLPVAYVSIPRDRGVYAVRYVSDGAYSQINYAPYSSYVSPRNDSDAAMGPYLYTIKAAALIVYATCSDKTVDPANVIVTMAVSNETTIDNAKAIAVIQKVLPLLQAQMRAKPDMVTDNNPTL